MLPIVGREVVLAADNDVESVSSFVSMDSDLRALLEGPVSTTFLFFLRVVVAFSLFFAKNLSVRRRR